MNVAPFTLKEGVQIMQQLDYLKNKQFSSNDTLFTIRSITIIPFEEEVKTTFLEALCDAIMGKGEYDIVEVAQKIWVFPSNEFDVILIATQMSSTDIFTLPVSLTVDASGDTGYGFPLSFV